MNYKNTNDREAKITELQDISLTCLFQLKRAGSQAFSSIGLTYGQATLLIFVERGHTSPKELAQLLNVVGPALSSLVTNLSDEGLLVRQDVAGDGRRVVVALTPQGVLACRRLREAWRKHFPVALDSFSDDELNVLIQAARMATQ